MNKEIEDILKNIKYAIDEDDYWEVTKETLIPLLSYIEQLEKENETLGEIVNIKDEQLKEMQIQKTDYTTVNILEAKIEQLENNRDKAIEFGNGLLLGEATFEERHIASRFLNILKGGSDD